MLSGIVLSFFLYGFAYLIMFSVFIYYYLKGQGKVTEWKLTLMSCLCLLGAVVAIGLFIWILIDVVRGENKQYINITLPELCIL